MRTFSARVHSRLDVNALRRGSAVYLERERQITRGEPNYLCSRLYLRFASGQAERLSASFRPFLSDKEKDIVLSCTSKKSTPKGDVYFFFQHERKRYQKERLMLTSNRKLSSRLHGVLLFRKLKSYAANRRSPL